MQKPITEKDGIQDTWYKEARDQTLESLPRFLKSLTEDYEHDYGTIVHAMAAGAIATAWAMNRTGQAGITGFQASCLMWSFIVNWMNYQDRPLKLVDFFDMLYPQNWSRFDKTISESTWKRLQEEAGKRLAQVDKEMASKDVISHWESISNGQVPFGYSIRGDDE